MIVKNVCLLLEALSIVICLHHLYGEKFRLDIATISFLSIDMIIMTAINYLGLSKTYTMIIYPIIVLYCGIRFGFQVKKLAVNIILCIILVGGIQILVASPICYLFNMHNFVEINLLLVNFIAFLIILIGFSFIKIWRVSIFLQDKERFLITIIIACMMIILFSVVNYKNFSLMDLNATLAIYSCIILVIVLSIQLVKYKLKAKEIETALKMQTVYADSFQGLIDNIRLRQHEFNNHIHTIYTMHYTYHTYNELVNVQKNYCDSIIEEKRFYKLLSCGNPVIAGFLYGRFSEFDKAGIEVSYEISVKGFEIGIPIYKIVEILGDLMNNAVEALLADSERNKLHVVVVEANHFYIEVRNESLYIEYNNLAHFFDKGYSQKGENRGLGLYNVKQICDEYKMEILCQNIEIDENNWLTFQICKEKETI